MYVYLTEKLRKAKLYNEYQRLSCGHTYLRYSACAIYGKTSEGSYCDFHSLSLNRDFSLKIILVNRQYIHTYISLVCASAYTQVLTYVCALTVCPDVCLRVWANVITFECLFILLCTFVSYQIFIHLKSIHVQVYSVSICLSVYVFVCVYTHIRMCVYHVYQSVWSFYFVRFLCLLWVKNQLGVH